MVLKSKLRFGKLFEDQLLRRRLRHLKGVKHFGCEVLGRYTIV